MWVVLVVGILNKESDRGRVDRLQQKLREIPGDLHDLFRDILTRDSNNKEELVLCIQWVLFAKQPLSPEQLYYAILSGIEPDALSAWDPEDVDQENIKRFILDCSKGLTDITASRNQKVQFIHESVRDFLLKGEGLSKIWPEYKENFLGQSHERLKQCCSAYLEIDLEESLDIPNPLPKANSDNARTLRSSAGLLFPLLEYAVHNIFYHSDLAERHGVSQAQFINYHQLKLWYWVRLHNMFEKFEVRRYQEDVGLMYVLAELDCGNLIRSHLPLENCCKRENERYGYPILAAYALGNNAAIHALSTNGVPTSTERDVDHDQVQRGTASTPIERPRRELPYLKDQSLLFNAAQSFPEWLLVRLLVSPKYIPKAQSLGLWNMLELATKRGLTIVVEKLLHDHVFDSDLERRWKNKSLHHAVENAHESIVKLLVLNGADIDFRHADRNPIHLASLKGFEKIAMFLLDERLDLIESKGSGGETPLFLAVNYGHASLAKRLILRGADIHFRSNTGYTVVAKACQAGLKDIIILLLDLGADINGQDGKSPLEATCSEGNEDIVKLLLERGADINAQGGYYGNALQEACYKGNQGIVELLVKGGANINTQGGAYGNALQAACGSEHQEIVELLLERGADINAQGGTYGNALQAACCKGNQGIVELLVKRGANINAQGGIYDNALQAACYKGEQEIVELLAKRGANINAQGGEYGNALQAACLKDKQEIVELLVKGGANINAQGGHFSSALQAACFWGNRDIVELLLERGADPNVQGGSHGTALRATGEPEIQQLLRKYGAKG